MPHELNGFPARLYVKSDVFMIGHAGREGHHFQTEGVAKKWQSDILSDTIKSCVSH
jgi:hypothetical protein